MSKTYKTSISTVSPDRVLVRGYCVSEMLGERNFGDMVYLLMTSELPKKNEGNMIDAMLVACAEHSINAPSIHTARTVASCGVPVQEAISAGISAIGENHGGAGEACAEILQNAIKENPETPSDELAAELVADARQKGIRFPGFGHRFHTPVDPRAVKLLELADEWGLSGAHISLAKEITAELQKATGRQLPMNVDGALAAIISDMGIDWRFGKSIFIIARTAGLAAHVHEEIATGKPLAFAGKGEIDYQGPQERPLAEKKK
ncbi:MAG: citryl-CoA lyase [Chloroflexi bacterium]|nr:MAG: citryl-CoA lyase [Chloroflexota bacterium]